MATRPGRHEITRRRIVYEVDGMRDVPVRRGLTYRNAADGALTMDVYYPPNAAEGARTPAVVFVNGYPDPGARAAIGCALKELESFVSWGQLLAASGLAAVVYETGNDPAADAQSMISYLQTNAGSLGLDGQRVGLWACSGHGPNALSLLMPSVDPGVITCGVFCYSFMLDLDGSAVVADAARAFGFANPVSRKLEELRRDVPLFIVRAGRDEFAGLNDALDRFVGRALGLNLPVTVVNHATAPHAFDLVDDSEESRRVIGDILAFLRGRLSA
jgi:hypothetical protein